MVTIDQNRWSRSVKFTGHDLLEWVVTVDQNTQQVAKLSHIQRVSLLRHLLEFAAVCGRVFSYVNAIRIRKHGLSLPLLPPEVPSNQLRQEILVKVNAVQANFLSPWEGSEIHHVRLRQQALTYMVNAAV